MIKLPTAKKTKKKFYNKYIYKVTLNVPGCGALRYYEFSDLLSIDSEVAEDQWKWKQKLINDVVHNRQEWIDLVFFIDSFEKDQWAKRLEGDYIDLYTNNLDFYNGLCEKFPNRIVKRYQPPAGLEQEMLDEEKKIFVKEIPHGIYNYQAYLHPHKLTSNQTERTKLADWLELQVPKITFSNSIKKWVLQTRENWDRRYIYIDNDQTLLMIKLRSPELIGKVFKYVKTDK